MRSALASLARSVRVFRTVLRNPDLRRVELAFLGFHVAELATWIAILVYAYEAGGASTAGLVGVVQLVPAAAFAPIASVFADRYRRDRVLLAGYLAPALAMTATAAVLLVGAPLAVVTAFAALAATCVTIARPAQAALFPSLARTPEELTATNVASGTIESLGLVIGPAVAGVLLDVWTPGVVFAVMAALLLCAAITVNGVAAIPAPRTVPVEDGATGVLGDLLGGFRTLAREPRPRLVVAMLGTQIVGLGALDLLLVVLAYSLLDTGSGGVGFLNAAFGVGSVLGAAGTVMLIGRQRLAPPLLGGALAWGAALGLTGVIPHPVAAPLLVAAAGAGRLLVDVAGRTLLQRVVADRVLARVFGVLEGIAMAALALGMAVTPALFSLLGERATFLVIGASLPILGLLTWRGLALVDAHGVAPAAQLAVLRAVPIFAPLSAPVVERLAARLIPVNAAAGTVIIRQGETGDRFYVIVTGQVTVTIDGRILASLGPHDFFGEIALLHNIPRTATVTARTNVHLYALERADFLEGVTGYPESARAADAVAQIRLDEQRR